jgi:hypothetical protein
MPGRIAPDKAQMRRIIMPGRYRPAKIADVEITVTWPQAARHAAETMEYSIVKMQTEDGCS